MKVDDEGRLSGAPLGEREAVGRESVGAADEPAQAGVRTDDVAEPVEEPNSFGLMTRTKYIRPSLRPEMAIWLLRKQRVQPGGTTQLIDLDGGAAVREAAESRDGGWTVTPQVKYRLLLLRPLMGTSASPARPGIAVFR